MPFINIGGVLCHHGIPGMEWGKRRFQNPDGSLTEAGKRRYAKNIKRRVRQSPTEGGGRSVASKEVASDILTQPNMMGMEGVYETVSGRRDRLETLRKKLAEFDDSPEKEQARQQAYDETYSIMERDFPDELASMIQANGGSKTGLDAYHDFDTLMDGVLDDCYNAAQDAWSKRVYNGRVSVDAVQKAQKAYQESCSWATEELLGRYGKQRVKVNSAIGSSHYVKLENILADAFKLMDSTPIDWWPKD